MTTPRSTTNPIAQRPNAATAAITVAAFVVVATIACTANDKPPATTPTTTTTTTTTATGPTCTTDLDCAQAVNLNQWRGKTSANPLPPYADADCRAGRRDTRTKPVDTLRDDGDALSCKSGLCDATGMRSVPLVALIDKDQCLIGGTCLAATTSHPDSARTDKTSEHANCQLCSPSPSQAAWSPRPAGNPCADDKLGCAAYACDANGGYGRGKVAFHTRDVATRGRFLTPLTAGTSLATLG